MFQMRTRACLERSRKVLSPRTKVDTGQNDFLGAAFKSRANIEKHIRQRTASPLATRDGGDAESAAIIASILNFDEGPRAVMKSGQRLALQRFKVKG